VGNRPQIRTYYVLSALRAEAAREPAVIVGNQNDRLPFLVTTYRNSGDSDTSGSDGREARKVDGQNPSAVLESRSEYGVAGSQPSASQ